MLHTDLIAPIPDLLRRHAAARGEKIAYRDAQIFVTYAGLLERTGPGKIIRYKLREAIKA
jgi:long-chain acyl-CoA synthetase